MVENGSTKEHHGFSIGQPVGFRWCCEDHTGYIKKLTRSSALIEFTEVVHPPVCVPYSRIFALFQPAKASMSCTCVINQTNLNEFKLCPLHKALVLNIIDKCCYWAERASTHPTANSSYRGAGQEISAHIMAGWSRIQRDEPFDPHSVAFSGDTDGPSKV